MASMDYDRGQFYETNVREMEFAVNRIVKPIEARIKAIEDQDRQSQSAQYRLQALAYAFNHDGSFDQEKATRVAEWLEGKASEGVNNG